MRADRASRWLGPLLCFAAAWMALHWLQLRSVPEVPAISAVDIAPASADWPARTLGPWEPHALPWSSCAAPCTHRHFLLRHQFSLAATPSREWAVHIPLYSANVHLYLDGQPIDRQGRINAPVDAYTYHSRLVRIPASALGPGEHTLLIHLAADLPPRGGVGPVWLGPVDDVEAPHLVRRWLTEHAVLGVAWALACSLLVAALLRRQRPGEGIRTWFLACAPFWLLQALLQVAPEALPAELPRLLLSVIAHFGCTTLTPLFMLSLLGEPDRRVRKVLLIACGCGIGLTASGLWWLPDSPYRMVELSDGTVQLLSRTVIAMRLASLAILPWMLWLAFRIARERRWSRSAAWLVLCASLPAVAALSDLLRASLMPPIQIPMLPLGGIGVVLALWLELGQRMRRSERELARHAQVLESTLRAREAELAQSFERLREADRERALAAERQRLLRDMHDGVGGQLASLVHLADNPATDRARVVEGLREGLADLRLILDSLAQQEDDLLVALGRLRHRIEPTLQSAGIALEWNIDPAMELPPWPPEAVLHLYRMVQEAVHNTIRHARARRVRISLEPTTDGLRLEVADDGIGMPSIIPGRHYGLSGLQDRARRLGGKLEIDSTLGKGCSVRLILPSHSPMATNSTKWG